ncbi:MAG: hypothetical protein M1837_005409 [Sclerophora amabilis]|nr:MAG: hypothetical protein M1837_005409 [Sclerophora amabilis]
MKITLPQLLFGVFTLSSAVVSDSTKSLVLCTTLLGGVSKNPVPSKTFALTVTSRATLSITSTPVSTITPPALTRTISETTTLTSTITNPQVTRTYSSEVTTTVVGTTTSTIQSTITSLVTTTSTFDGTTTIPTSPGFTPAASQTNFPPARMVRRVEARAPKYRTQCKAGSDGIPTFSPKLYPTQVLCGGLVKVIQTTTKTFTASTTATVTGTPPPASSTTVTETTTTTSTVVPDDASTTLFSTETASSLSTVFSTTTSTITSTTTQVIQAPQATYYAACGPENQLSTVGDGNVYGFGTNNAVSQLSNIKSPYDCCVACLTSPTCGASVVFSGGNGVCFLVAQTGGTCDPKAVVLNYFTRPGVPKNDFVSTSNCGAIALSSTT